MLTVGHSTHSIERFLALLEGAGAETVADVRRFPGSRRHPQFGADALRASLATTGIGYEHFGEELGGRRRSQRRPASPSPWRNASFAAYAEHTETEEFARGLARLEALGRERRVAIMCAEAQWWRCHRRLIADALLARGWDIVHVGSDGRREPHANLLTPRSPEELG